MVARSARLWPPIPQALVKSRSVAADGRGAEGLPESVVAFVAVVLRKAMRCASRRAMASAKSWLVSSQHAGRLKPKLPQQPTPADHPRALSGPRQSKHLSCAEPAPVNTGIHRGCTGDLLVRGGQKPWKDGPLICRDCWNRRGPISRNMQLHWLGVATPGFKGRTSRQNQPTPSTLGMPGPGPTKHQNAAPTPDVPGGHRRMSSGEGNGLTSMGSPQIRNGARGFRDPRP